MCQHVKNHISYWPINRGTESLSIIEYLLGIEQDDVGSFCIAQIHKLNHEMVAFHSIQTTETEIRSILDTIINTYFKN